MDDLNAFKQDKVKYNSQFNANTDEQYREKLLYELREKSKRYLGTAITIISEKFGIKYSINKNAPGLTSSFKKISSIVRKSDNEVLNEMQNFENSLDSLSLNEKDKEELLLAIEVVKMYCSNNEVSDETSKKEEEPEASESVTLEESADVLVENKPIKKEKFKDSSFIIYKVIIGLFLIPLVSFMMLAVFFFLANAFTGCSLYKSLMDNKSFYDMYPTILKGIIIFLAFITTFSVNAFFKGKTNNRIVFSILPFTIVLLIVNFFENIVNYINDNFSLDSVPIFLKNFDHSFVILFFYALIIFFYFFAIFQRHTETKKIDYVSIVIMVYTGIISGIYHILEILGINPLGNLLNKMCDFKYSSILITVLLVVSLVINFISPFIKEKEKN